MPSPDTSVNKIGLRNRCPDGHRILWWDTVNDVVATKDEYATGVCASGDAWYQARTWRDAAGRRNTRLSPSTNGVVDQRSKLSLTYKFDRLSGSRKAELEVRCRDGHPVNRFEEVDVEADFPEPDITSDPDATLQEVLTTLEGHGWTLIEGMLECHWHREKREKFEAAMATLKAEEVSEVAHA